MGKPGLRAFMGRLAAVLPRYCKRWYISDTLTQFRRHFRLPKVRRIAR